MKCPQRSEGYSLIEMTLALLVAALGVMAVFALFPQGLDASRRAVDATETAAFADQVFASLDIAMLYADWTNVVNGGLGLVYVHAMRDGGNIIVPEGPPPGNVQTNEWVPAYYGEEDWYVDQYAVAVFTYALDIMDGRFPNTKSVYLTVWPGNRTDLIQMEGDAPGKTLFYREYVRRDVF